VNPEDTRHSTQAAPLGRECCLHEATVVGVLQSRVGHVAAEDTFDLADDKGTPVIDLGDVHVDGSENILLEGYILGRPMGMVDESREGGILDGNFDGLDDIVDHDDVRSSFRRPDTTDEHVGRRISNSMMIRGAGIAEEDKNGARRSETVCRSVLLARDDDTALSAEKLVLRVECEEAAV